MNVYLLEVIEVVGHIVGEGWRGSLGSSWAGGWRDLRSHLQTEHHKPHQESTRTCPQCKALK